MIRPDLVFDRRQFVVGAAALTLGCESLRSGREPRQVLFVCEHGSVKSPIAREHFRRIIAARGMQVAAISRGIHPLEDVSPRLAAALAAEAIDPRRDPLTRLTRADLAAADIVVTFNPIPKDLTRGLRLDLHQWFDVPAMNDDYAAARQVLLGHLEALADALAKN